MSERTKRIGEMIGGKHVATLPDTGGGTFGAARVGHIVSQIQRERLATRLNVRRETAKRVYEFAKRSTAQGNPISADELASQLLDEAITKLEQQEQDSLTTGS